MAEQRERQRLAQMLHDHLQQLLVGAKFNILMLRAQPNVEQLNQSLQQVTDLLDASLRASRSLTAELSPPVLRHGTLADVLRWLAGWMFDTHGLRVHLAADDEVNPTAEEIRLLVFQACRELLFNVVKHSHVREACMQLARADDDHLEIAIADAGQGFDPAVLDDTTRKSGGFGLLSIRERLSLLGGAMSIRSGAGEGTSVTLVAPVKMRSTAESPPPVAKARPTAEVCVPVAKAEGACLGDRIRVLLADDHKVVRDGLARLLQTSRDVEVIAQASDGREAVDLARQVRPHVVIMDVAMPNLNGIDATRHLKAEMPDIRVIGLSMHEDANVAEAMTSTGAAAYLTKTEAADSLIDAVMACRCR